MNKFARYSFIALAAFQTIFYACKSDFPSAPTTISGILTDSNNIPVQGIEVRFAGIRNKGLSGITVFEEFVLTDNEGKYRLTKTVPNATDFASCQPTSDNINAFFLIRNGRLHHITAPLVIEPKDYGTAITRNFILKRLP
ncbi:carboxypeptidase regulatory-like domain-containing protein [Dyadobacter arcticus]|uniref:Carboxypeptidase regulatory-like domain-containing protein n=1 Tax=Dyadobacter arcticus TaxID=1078754 RepID=A0ABX0UH84_9BACT|nr:carboxypeptidase regulatory-like domain-containing protein [Dyadobacter arcticus]NIJ52373.1 hypothetical protein [Dyadobacter arcticus]